MYSRGTKNVAICLWQSQTILRSDDVFQMSLYQHRYALLLQTCLLSSSVTSWTNVLSYKKTYMCTRVRYTLS